MADIAKRQAAVWGLVGCCLQACELLPGFVAAPALVLGVCQREHQALPVVRQLWVCIGYASCGTSRL